MPCNDNWKYLFQTYKVPQHNIQWSLDLVMPSAHCCTACTMHMIYHPHHRPTTVLSDGSLQRHLKEANSTNIAFFVQKAFVLPPSPSPRLDHLGYKFCDVYLLQSMLMCVATKIDKKRQKSVKNMSNILQSLKKFKLLFKLTYAIPKQKMRPKNKENDDGTEILRCHDSLLHINPWFDISSSGPRWAEGFYFNTC